MLLGYAIGVANIQNWDQERDHVPDVAEPHVERGQP